MGSQYFSFLGKGSMNNQVNYNIMGGNLKMARTYTCTFCEMKTKQRSNLKKHIMIKHCKETFQCDLCDFTNHNKYVLNRHRKDHYRVKDSFQCDSCDFHAINKATVKNHYDSIHLGIKYSCSVCPYMANSRPVLYSHVKREHKIQDKVEERQCRYCEHKSKNKRNLRLHEESIHEGKKHNCSECGKIYSQARGLSQHIANEHKKVRYSCEYCSHKAKRKEYLQQHIESVHHGKKYPCGHCDYQASTKGSLQLHVKSKHEGKMYQCSECDDIFTYKTSVKYHVDAIHRGIQSQCKICDKTVSTMGLRSHMKTAHQGPKIEEYSCNICSFKTKISKAYLAKHIRTKHEGFRFKCQLCEAELSRKENVERHIKRYHLPNGTREEILKFVVDG